MSSEHSRRDFLKYAAAGTLAASELSSKAVAQDSTNAKPLRLGFVGVGDRASYHLDIALWIE